MPQALKPSDAQSVTLPGTIYRLEAGDRQPRLPTIIVLAKVLGMTASDLIRDL